MSNQYLNTLSENATRFGMRLQETISERTRELGLGAIATSAAALEAPADEKAQAALRRQLEGSSDRDKLDAMKRLVALISKGRNVSAHFASVVKNVASPNLEIRKLVYIFLLRYAEHEPDLALLSINTFQRDLADANPLIRAMALRVLSGIRVPMIGSIVVLAIRKCAGDASPYVRKAAALAIPKCYELDASHLPALIQIITQILLRDRSPLSLGSVAVAFSAVCPTRLELLHPHFRRLCRVLVDVDEWGQVEIMRLLLRYVRVMCARTREGKGEEGEREGAEEGTEGLGFGYEEEIDKDVKLLLDSVLPVLQSRNPAVVMAAARVLFYAGPARYWLKLVQPLLRLLNASKEVERVVLVDLVVICKTAPELFAPYYTRFLVRSDDLTPVKKDKIRLLLSVLTVDNYAAILRELIDCADDTNDEVVAAAIDGLGKCARRIPASVSQCLTALIRMIKSRYDTVVSSAVLVLKGLVQMQLASQDGSFALTGGSEQSPMSIIAHLARRIDDIKHGQARACVVWLVGQYAGADVSPSSVASSTPTIPGVLGAPEGIADWAPDVLRKLAKSFAEESVLVKLQVVTLAAKLFVLSPFDRRIAVLARYVLSLARYDVNYDLRDRGRMLAALLAGVGLEMNGEGAEERGGVVLRREQVRLVLFEGKAKTDDTRETAVQGNRFMGMEEELPDWVEKGVESALRDSEDDAPPAPPVATAISSAGPVKGKGVVGLPSPPIVLTPMGAGTSSNGGKGQFMDLDSFYAEEEESEEEEEEDEEGDSDSDREEGSEEESGSEEGSSEETKSGDDVTPSTPVSERSVYFDAPMQSSQDYVPAPVTTTAYALKDDASVPEPAPGPSLKETKPANVATDTLGNGDVVADPDAGYAHTSKPFETTANTNAKPLVEHPNGSEGWLPAEDVPTAAATNSGKTSPAPFNAHARSGTAGSTFTTTSGGGEGGNVGVGVIGVGGGSIRRSTSRRSAYTASDREGRPIAGSAFVNGAGTTGPHATAEAGEDVVVRTQEANGMLTPKQKSKIAKDEAKNGKRLSKIIKQEAKTEKKSLEISIKELDNLLQLQKNAVKSEARVQVSHGKLLHAFKKAEAAYLNAKMKYETAQAELNTEADTLEVLRANAREATQSVQDKSAEVDALRRTLALDEREREVKLGQLKGSRRTSFWN